MIRGESGILACSRPGEVPHYEPSKRRLTWPSGAEALTFSADEPDQMRGPQQDTAWADELAAWQYPDAWDQLTMGLRSVASGLKPRVVVTTTPRPTDIVKQLIADDKTHKTRGSTFDNIGNLAPSFIAKLRRKYEGTRIGRQELYAEVLDDAPGALWQRARIDFLRVSQLPELREIVIAVDPATTSGEDSDESGIVIAGLGINGHGYVLSDLSGRYTPYGWGSIVVDEYKTRKANRIVAETNQGGDLVESNIKTVADARKTTVFVDKIHASRGKRARAEPVSGLYEQGLVHHVGCFPELEDQQCEWEPGSKDSPDRLDALVYALTSLMVDKNPNASQRRPGMVKTQFGAGVPTTNGKGGFHW